MADGAAPTDTRDRILDAAVEVASIHGLTRLSVGDVAKRAGLSRPTLYKHFGSKDELVAAAVAREAMDFTDQIVSVVDTIDDPRDALEAAMLTALELAREHPLLDRIVRTEPEALVPLLTADGGPVMLLARGTVEGVLMAKFAQLDAVQTRRFADIVTRLLVSYAVSAPDDPPEVVAASIATFLVDGALSVALAVSPTDHITDHDLMEQS